MTEEEWLQSFDPIRMAESLFYLRKSDRKMRLFACACSGPHLHLVSDVRFLKLRRLVQERADELIGPGECDAYRKQLQIEFNQVVNTASPTAAKYVADSILQAAREPYSYERGYYESEDDLPFACWAADSIQLVCTSDAELKQEELRQAALLRDIFGNPFRPVAFDPNWRTSTAVGLAQTMYDARHFHAMPILADALQDAGCEDAAVLGHCRDANGVHVRGCWVVDLVFDKK